MCYGMGCPNEKRNGDCKLSGYPKGFICPPDREDADIADTYEPDYDAMLEYKREAREGR